jgi:hypothetical protein
MKRMLLTAAAAIVIPLVFDAVALDGSLWKDSWREAQTRANQFNSNVHRVVRAASQYW